MCGWSLKVCGWKFEGVRLEFEGVRLECAVECAVKCAVGVCGWCVRLGPMLVMIWVPKSK